MITDPALWLFILAAAVVGFADIRAALKQRRMDREALKRSAQETR